MAKRRAWLAMSAMLLMTAAAVSAQSILDLPRASQKAEVKQRIGVTDITVNYGRPLVKGRKVWGGLVPYGKVWRAGADENTTIEFTDPVTIEGKQLDKGVYGDLLEDEHGVGQLQLQAGRRCTARAGEAAAGGDARGAGV